MHDRAKDPPEDKWSWHLHTQKKLWEDERTFTAEQLQRIANFTGLKGPVDIRAFVDVVYIPTRLTRDVVPLMRRVHVNYGHGELNVGLGLVSLESPANWVSWTEEYLWDNWGLKERTRDR